MRFTCVFTVAALTTSAFAISASDRPASDQLEHLGLPGGELVRQRGQGSAINTSATGHAAAPIW